jgi:hypothetical protein
LVLDPLYKLTSLNLQDPSSAMPVIREFEHIRESFPALCILIAHHLRKTQDVKKGRTWDDAYGPMFFFADMDFELRIEAPHKKDPNFNMEYLSNDVPVDPVSLHRDPETLLYTREVEIKGPHAVEITKEIIDFVRKSRPIRTNLESWIVATFGFSGRKAKKLVSAMMKQNQMIRSQGKGKGTRGVLTVPGDENSENR